MYCQPVPGRLHRRIRNVNSHSHRRNTRGCAMGFMADSSAKRLRNNRGLTSVRVSDGSTPRFLQGPFEFEGNGLDKPSLIDESLRYVVPAGAVTQPVYFRGGNPSKQMIAVVLFRDGKPMRYFPIAAKGATHVALRVVEDLLADTVLEIFIAAPEAVAGTVIVDLGLVEI